MSWDTIEFILRLMQFFVVPFGIWVVLQIFGLRGDLTKLAARVSRNEERLGDLPGNKALHDLALGVEALRGEVRAVHAKIGGLEAVVSKLDRILERQEAYLLNGGADR